MINIWLNSVLNNLVYTFYTGLESGEDNSGGGGDSHEGDDYYGSVFHHGGATFNVFPDPSGHHDATGCSRADTKIMNKLLSDSAPYLFPCTIEYSLICAAILFVMWKNIATEHEYYLSEVKGKKSNAGANFWLPHNL